MKSELVQFQLPPPHFRHIHRLLIEQFPEDEDNAQTGSLVWSSVAFHAAQGCIITKNSRMLLPPQRVVRINFTRVFTLEKLLNLHSTRSMYILFFKENLHIIVFSAGERY